MSDCCHATLYPSKVGLHKKEAHQYLQENIKKIGKEEIERTCKIDRNIKRDFSLNLILISFGLPSGLLSVFATVIFGTYLLAILVLFQYSKKRWMKSQDETIEKNISIYMKSFFGLTATELLKRLEPKFDKKQSKK